MYSFRPILYLFDLCLITNSCIVWNCLEQLLSVICVKGGIILSLVLPR
jgi:hypothetical protein